MTANRYEARGEIAPQGEARIHTRTATIPFDGSASLGDELPGPAHLLASALAACVLKNVERFSHILPFAYRGATVEVALEREDRPPRIARATYRLIVDTDETAQRCRLLHKNITKFGTISNTLARSCELKGSMAARREAGSLVEVDPIASEEA